MKEEVSDASTQSTLHPRVPGGGCALGPDQRAFRREVAADLGIGLSTLRNGIDRRRERPREPPPDGRQEDRAAELKRLRRANEGLRQEREILTRAPALFAQEKVDEVPAHRGGDRRGPRPTPGQGSRGEPERLLRRAEPPGLSATARGPRAAGPCPLGLCALEGDLRQPAPDARPAGHRPRRRPPSDGPAEARDRVARAAAAPLQAHHRQPARRPGRPQPDRAGRLDRAPRREGGRRPQLYRDARGLAVPGGCHGSVRPARGGLGRQRPAAQRGGARRPAPSPGRATTRGGSASSFGPRSSIWLDRGPGRAAPARRPDLDVRQGERLRSLQGRDGLQDLEERASTTGGLYVGAECACASDIRGRAAGGGDATPTSARRLHERAAVPRPDATAGVGLPAR